MKKNVFIPFRIIWVALMTMSSLFLAVSFVMKDSFSPFVKNTGLEYIALGVSAMSIVSSALLYKMLLKTAGQESVLRNKMQAYTRAVIIKGAMLEGGSVLCSVVYMLTNVQWVLGGSIAGILIMLVQIPTRQRCIDELQLSLPEIEELERGGEETK
jgi:hypothetical protein